MSDTDEREQSLALLQGLDNIARHNRRQHLRSLLTQNTGWGWQNEYAKDVAELLISVDIPGLHGAPAALLADVADRAVERYRTDAKFRALVEHLRELAVEYVETARECEREKGRVPR